MRWHGCLAESEVQLNTGRPSARQRVRCRRPRRIAPHVRSHHPARQRASQRPGIDTSRPLDDPSLIEDGTQATQRVDLGFDHDFALPPPRVIQERGDVQRDVLRQIEPEQRTGHILDERPDRVALAVIDGKIAAVPARGRGEMMDHRLVDVQTPVALEPESKPEIDIFEVAEVAFVESANFFEGLP